MISLTFFEKRSRTFIIAATAVLLLIIAALDYATGTEFSFSVFYLLPISLAGWRLGQRAGLTAALAGAVLWLAADLLGGSAYSNPSIPYWNAAVRLAFFVIVTYALAQRRAARARQEEFAQFVVHDLRAPLGNVITALELIRDRGAEIAPATQVDLTSRCLTSARRMITLINSLLDVPRLEAGQMPVAWEAVPAADLVEAGLQQVSVWAANNGVRLEAQVAESVGSVRADRLMAERVLVNLLSNAIKFSPHDSLVRVAAARRADGRVAFSVSDEGQGVPQEMLAQVFEKHAQIPNRRTDGAGLGLTFCRLAVEAQGGRIWLENAAPTGLIVFFTLAAAENGG